MFVPPSPPGIGWPRPWRRVQSDCAAPGRSSAGPAVPAGNMPWQGCWPGRGLCWSMASISTRWQEATFVHCCLLWQRQIQLIYLMSKQTNKQHIVRRSELKMRINVRRRSLGAGQKYNIIDKSPPQKPPSDNAVHFQDSKNTMMKTMMWCSILPFSFMWCFTFQ